MTRLFWEEAARHLSGLIKVIMGIFSTFNLAGTRQGQSCPQGNLGQGSTTERPRAECSADRVSAGLGFQSGPRGNVSGRQRMLGGSGPTLSHAHAAGRAPGSRRRGGGNDWQGNGQRILKVHRRRQWMRVKNQSSGKDAPDTRYSRAGLVFAENVCAQKGLEASRETARVVAPGETVESERGFTSALYPPGRF